MLACQMTFAGSLIAGSYANDPLFARSDDDKDDDDDNDV